MQLLLLFGDVIAAKIQFSFISIIWHDYSSDCDNRLCISHNDQELVERQRVCYCANQGNSWVFQLTIRCKLNPKHRSNSSYVSQREATAGTLSVTLILLRIWFYSGKLCFFLSPHRCMCELFWHYSWCAGPLRLTWSSTPLKPKEFQVNCRRRKSDLQPIGINWEEVVWIGWPCNLLFLDTNKM